MSYSVFLSMWGVREIDILSTVTFKSTEGTENDNKYICIIRHAIEMEQVFDFFRHRKY